MTAAQTKEHKRSLCIQPTATFIYLVRLFELPYVCLVVCIPVTDFDAFRKTRHYKSFCTRTCFAVVENHLEKATR